MKTVFTLTIILISVAALADITHPLSAKDPLAQVARAVGTNLRDSNISTGTTELWAGKLLASRAVTRKDDFEELVRFGFSEAFQKRYDGALRARIQLKVNKFVDGDGRAGDVYEMTSALIESNAYNTQSKKIRESSARALWAVLRKLPVSENTMFGHASSRLKDDSSGEMRTLQYFLLLNPDGRAVQFFTVEGTM
jgi:hypothetical protein